METQLEKHQAIDLHSTNNVFSHAIDEPHGTDQVISQTSNNTYFNASYSHATFIINTSSRRSSKPISSRQSDGQATWNRSTHIVEEQQYILQRILPASHSHNHPFSRIQINIKQPMYNCSASVLYVWHAEINTMKHARVRMREIIGDHWIYYVCVKWLWARWW